MTVARLTVAAVLALVLIVPYAEATCAWVLWGAYGKGAAAGTVAPRQYRPMRTFTKQTDCNEYEGVWNRTQRVDGWVESVCLPDTIDPRGPKARGDRLR